MIRTRINFDDLTAEIIELSGQVLTVTINKVENWNPSVSFSWRSSIEKPDAELSAFTFYQDEVKQKFNTIIESPVLTYTGLYD